jgi:hypothetical protein
MTFGTSGTEAMRITSASFVGIGTTSPNFKLDVNGAGHFYSTLYSGSTGLAGRMTFNRALDGSGQAIVGYSSVNSSTQLQIRT